MATHNNIITLSLNTQKSRGQDRKGPSPDTTNPTTIGVDRVVTGVRGLKITMILRVTIYTPNTTPPDAGADQSHPEPTTDSNLFKIIVMELKLSQLNRIPI